MHRSTTSKSQSVSKLWHNLFLPLLQCFTSSCILHEISNIWESTYTLHLMLWLPQKYSCKDDIKHFNLHVSQENLSEHLHRIAIFHELFNLIFVVHFCHRSARIKTAFQKYCCTLDNHDFTSSKKCKQALGYLCE